MIATRTRGKCWPVIYIHWSPDLILTARGDGDREENRIGAAHLLVRTSKDCLTYILARLALPADGDDNRPCRYYDYYLIFSPCYYYWSVIVIIYYISVGRAVVMRYIR